MANWNALITLAAIVNMTCACAPDPTTKIAGLDTANAVSLDPDAPNSYRNFAPELDRTLARVPRLDPVMKSVLPRNGRSRSLHSAGASIPFVCAFTSSAPG